MAPNILVVPAYKLNSLYFFKDVVQKIRGFKAVENVLIQFEFSVFGGKIVIPQFLVLLLVFKLLGKSTKIMFHQVVDDINVLSGHLAIKKNGLKSSLLNDLLRIFYTMSGALADKVFVHDKVLAKRLGEFVNEAKIRVIPHGMSGEEKLTTRFSMASKRHFSVDKGTKLVGIFGYCSWYKGTDWLIENFARFTKENPKIKVRLLVAGGQSPTLKGTLAYKKYHGRLKKVIKKANGNIVYTGYVPDADVRRVFAATDLMIFPYRTKMSASGAFALCQSYRKPYIVSAAFAENINKKDAYGKTFALNYASFADVLNNNLQNFKNYTCEVSEAGSWENVAQTYLSESLPETSLAPKLSYV